MTKYKCGNKTYELLHVAKYEGSFLEHVVYKDELGVVYVRPKSEFDLKCTKISKADEVCAAVARFRDCDCPSNEDLESILCDHYDELLSVLKEWELEHTN